MPDIAALITTGTTNAWLFLPIAVLLGAFHALEPGHAKSIMAAFIVAIRGTPGQATVLGISAAIGHTIVVWVIAAIGLWLGDKLILDRAEPYLLLASGLLIMVLAGRLFGMLRADEHHEHVHPHDQ
jgi:nickel/cobalt transporter (NicO) family protein